MRYYSTQRPVGPGTFPKLPENKVLEVHNFDAKTFCEEIGREAWGYIDFESPLTQEQADNYELIAPDVGCTGCVNETASRDMDCCWNCSRNLRSKKDLYRRRPAGGMQSLSTMQRFSRNWKKNGPPASTYTAA